MIGKIFRDWLNKTLKPLGKSIPINPNYVTILAVPFALIAGYFIIIGNYGLAALFVLISTFVDNIDGAIAKANNRTTLFGSYLDAMTDKLQEIIILFGFAFREPFGAFLALSGTFLVSYAKPRAEMVVPLGNPDWPGIGERAERIIIITLTLLALHFNISSGFCASTMFVGLFILAFVTYVGAFQRFLFGREILKEQDKKRTKVKK